MRSAIILSIAMHLITTPTWGNLLVNGGFETTVSIPHDSPASCRYWAWDRATIISGLSDGIEPREGQGMLRFDYTSTHGPSEYVACEVIQLVDLTGYHALVQAGQALAVATGWFNRALGDAQTDTGFGLEIRAFPGVPSSFPSQYGVEELAIANSMSFSDGDILTWEATSVNLPLPTDSGYLAVRLYASEDIYNDTTGVELDGHYADEVSLEIVPEPATLLLLALGGLMVMRPQ